MDPTVKKTKLVTDYQLVQVQTIKAKFARQIKVLCYDGAVYRELTADIMAGRAVPVGWIDAQVLDMGSLRELWLVRWLTDGRLAWMLPPSSGEVFDLHNGRLAQLFAD